MTDISVEDGLLAIWEYLQEQKEDGNDNAAE